MDFVFGNLQFNVLLFCFCFNSTAVELFHSLLSRRESKVLEYSLNGPNDQCERERESETLSVSQSAYSQFEFLSSALITVIITLRGPSSRKKKIAIFSLSSTTFSLDCCYRTAASQSL